MGGDTRFLYQDPAATNVSVGYKNAAFFCESIAPPLPEDKPTGNIWVFGKEKFALRETARAPKAEAREVPPWAFTQIKYFTTNHSLKDGLDDDQRNSADPGLDWEINTTENLTQNIIVRQEYDLMQAIINDAGPHAPATAVPNTTLSGTSQWSDFTNSDPILAVENQKTTIQKTTGQKPNTLAVSFPVHQVIRQHPRILDRFKYTQKAILDAGDLKTAFSVDNYWVLEALYDTNSEGQTPSTDYIWGKNAFLGIVPSAPRKREVALAYTVFWTFAQTGEGASTGATGMENNRGLIVRRYRFEPKHMDVLEVEKHYDVVFPDVNAGYVFINAVA